MRIIDRVNRDDELCLLVHEPSFKDGKAINDLLFKSGWAFHDSQGYRETKEREWWYYRRNEEQR